MFAQIRASTVAAASTEALPVSVRRNMRSGVSMRRAQAVRPENGPPDCSPESAESPESAAPMSSEEALAASRSSEVTSITSAASGDDSLTRVSLPQASQPPGVGDAPEEAPGTFVRRLTEQL